MTFRAICGFGTNDIKESVKYLRGPKKVISKAIPIIWELDTSYYSMWCSVILYLWVQLYLNELKIIILGDLLILFYFHSLSIAFFHCVFPQRFSVNP